MTINNFDDILRAMEQDPALRDAMRRHILTEELLQLPAQVTRLETSVDRLETSVDRLETWNRLETRMDNLEAGQEELKGRMDKLEDGQSRLEAGQEELKGRVSTMAGRLGAIVGSDYEARSLRVAPRKLRQVMGIRNATLILAARQTPLKDILPVLDRAMTSGKITEAEAEDLENVDLAFTGEDPSGNTVQAAIEASITISLEDIRRAIRRAEILERATMVPSRAAVIGENISQEDQTEAGNLGVAFLYMPAHRE